MRKLRIAVWHNLPSGGGKRQLYNHVKGLVERGYFVESWCPETADQQFLPLGEIVTENIVPLGVRSDQFHDAFKTAETVNALLQTMEAHCRNCGEEINRKDFDVLFANSCLYLRTTPIAKYVDLPSLAYLNEPYRQFYEALPELPWIASEVSYTPGVSWRSLKDFLFGKNTLDGIRLQARAELEYIRHFDLVLANSVFSRESILRTYNLDSKVCYLGIDTEYYRPTGETKEDYVIGIGTIYHGKGIDRAVKAIATIEKEKRPDLIWIGNGASPHDLKKYDLLARELGVNLIPKIHISDKEVVSLLSKAAAMIYTPRLEPFGLAPLEANSCGTCVVGIAEGGVKETVKDGVNGFLVREDDPIGLGQLLYRFVDNRQLAHDMGVSAREYVINSWNVRMATDNIEGYLTQLNATKNRQWIRNLLCDEEALQRIAVTNDVKLGIEKCEFKNGRMCIKGWAHIDDGIGSTESETFVTVIKNATVRLIRANRTRRHDVTEYFGNQVDYDESGFSVDRLLDCEKPFAVGIVIVRSGKIGFQLLDGI
jgi:glycosyltransferase involved in cell wall biosynthesis